MIRVNLNHAGLYLVTACPITGISDNLLQAFSSRTKYFTHPTTGLRKKVSLPVRSFNPFEQSSQGQSDDLRNAEPGGVLEFSEDFNVSCGETDGRGFPPARSVAQHRPKSNTTAKRYRKGSTSASWGGNHLDSGPAPVAISAETGVLRDELLEVLISRAQFSWGVLEYLAWAEGQEDDVWLRDDIRLAWLTVLYAARGYKEPWVYAFCMTFGKHPSKAIPIWQERRDKWAAMPEVASCSTNTSAPAAESTCPAPLQSVNGLSLSSAQNAKPTSTALLYLTAQQEIDSSPRKQPSPERLTKRRTA